ncbi:DUF551 domain-containing protein [Klebsiella pneumoniae]|nr:DUF551 domain-containing protein [Klebsiella pneumoniae]MBK4886295.1 DUF551 domain-containing protein [Klebsiella pneumoniae]MBZ1901530.1 DUF551 domain-containing protein [Klebsiella pneumoniae]HBR3556490.1 DUF551 domain-containing protein [Klebsiella pneumoniae]
MARMALAAMDSESWCLPLDYLQGHKDGLEWAAKLAEANHPETGDWLYDDPIELAKAIRKGPDMPPVQPVADSEPDRNPVLAYADSYRDMAKQGVESVPIWSVITDLERNIAPLYRHAQPAPVVMDDTKLRELFDSWFASDCSFDLSPEASEADNIAWRESYWYVWQRCRAAMLQELKKSAGTEAICRSDENVQVLHTKSPAQSDCCPAQNQGWIPVSERMPENDGAYLCWDNRYVTTYAFIFGAWQANQFVAKNITHWMPLPAAPQEVGDA